MSAPSSSPRLTIAVLGAGITGLQIALSILSSPSSFPQSKVRVLVIGQHFPGDESIAYTSPWAGGHWRSHAHSSPEDAELRVWDAKTYQEWRRLLRFDGAGKGEVTGKANGAKTGQEELEKEVGLGCRESILFWSEDTDETVGGTEGGGQGLWWRDVVSGFRVLSSEELARASHASGDRAGENDVDSGKIVFGARYDTVCINVPRYLQYMKERVMALGGEFVRATVRTEEGVEGVVEDVRRIVQEHDSQSAFPNLESKGTELEALVLATGLLSRSFLPEEEASKLYPVRGQTVLVSGEAPRAITHLFPGGDIWYVIPRPGSGTTILGGCKEVGYWDEKEDQELTRKILERARGLVPELLTNGGNEFEILSVQVGRRPGRKGGPRVEIEKEKMKAVRVVHAYGHEGAGYQNSIGSAEKVVKLLAET